MAALTVDEVNGVLARFAAAYSDKDVAAVAALISRDPDAVIVGTGADEVRVGHAAIRAQIEQDLEQADAVTLKLGPVRVRVRGDVGWAFAAPTAEIIVAGEQLRMPMRMTLVLVKTADEVLIHSGHLSVAFAGQQSGQSFANA